MCRIVPAVSQSAQTLIGTAEAAAMLGVSKATVKRYAHSGELPVVVQMPGTTGALLFLRRDVERLAKRRGAA